MARAQLFREGVATRHGSPLPCVCVRAPRCGTTGSPARPPCCPSAVEVLTRCQGATWVPGDSAHGSLDAEWLRCPARRPGSASRCRPPALRGRQGPAEPPRDSWRGGRVSRRTAPRWRLSVRPLSGCPWLPTGGPSGRTDPRSQDQPPCPRNDPSFPKLSLILKVSLYVGKTGNTLKLFTGRCNFLRVCWR